MNSIYQQFKNSDKKLTERSVRISKENVSKERIAEGYTKLEFLLKKLDDQVPQEIKDFLKTYSNTAHLFGYSKDSITGNHKAYVELSSKDTIQINKICASKELEVNCEVYKFDRSLIKNYSSSNDFKSNSIARKKYIRFTGKIEEHYEHILKFCNKRGYAAAQWLKQNKKANLSYIAISKEFITIYYYLDYDNR
jgi:hypothetical protein